jgi:hypothetical protein
LIGVKSQLETNKQKMHLLIFFPLEDEMF